MVSLEFDILMPLKSVNCFYCLNGFPLPPVARYLELRIHPYFPSLRPQIDSLLLGNTVFGWTAHEVGSGPAILESYQLHVLFFQPLSRPSRVGLFESMRDGCFCRRA